MIKTGLYQVVEFKVVCDDYKVILMVSGVFKTGLLVCDDFTGEEYKLSDIGLYE